MVDRERERQFAIWDRLYTEIENVLNRFGSEDDDDFLIHDDFHGHPQHKIYANTFEMLRPEVVKALQRVLDSFPGWEIVVAVTLPEKMKGLWPDMGLIIRAHEIIDGLQRQYFPPAWQSLHYEGSRPGTAND